jgi:hypothetical protein
MTMLVGSFSLKTEKFSSILSRFTSRTLAVVTLLLGVNQSAQAAKETLENPGHSRDNGL